MTGDPITENVIFTILTGQVKNISTGALYNAFRDAYNQANSGDVLRARNDVYASPAFDLPKDITVQGGCDCNFTYPPIGFTTLNGPVVISDGSVTLDEIVIN
jgi:hypothetical protein